MPTDNKLKEDEVNEDLDTTKDEELTFPDPDAEEEEKEEAKSKEDDEKLDDDDEKFGEDDDDADDKDFDASKLTPAQIASISHEQLEHNPHMVGQRNALTTRLHMQKLELDALKEAKSKDADKEDDDDDGDSLDDLEDDDTITKGRVDKIVDQKVKEALAKSSKDRVAEDAKKDAETAASQRAVDLKESQRKVLEEYGPDKIAKGLEPAKVLPFAEKWLRKHDPDVLDAILASKDPLGGAMRYALTNIPAVAKKYQASLNKKLVGKLGGSKGGGKLKITDGSSEEDKDAPLSGFLKASNADQLDELASDIPDFDDDDD